MGEGSVRRKVVQLANHGQHVGAVSSRLDPSRVDGLVAVSVVLVPAVAIGWLVLGRPAIPTDAWLLGVASAVLLATTWGVVRLREARDPGEVSRRIVGAMLVLAGAGVLAVAR